MLDFKKRNADNRALDERHKKYDAMLASMSHDPENFTRYMDAQTICELYGLPPSAQSSIEIDKLNEPYNRCYKSAMQAMYAVVKDTGALLGVFQGLQKIALQEGLDHYETIKDGDDRDAILDMEEYLWRSVGDVERTDKQIESCSSALLKIDYDLAAKGQVRDKALPSDHEKFCAQKAPIVANVPDMPNNLFASLQAETCFRLACSFSNLGSARMVAIDVDTGFMFFLKSENPEFVQNQLATKLFMAGHNLVAAKNDIRQSDQLMTAITGIIQMQKEVAAERPKPIEARFC